MLSPPASCSGPAHLALLQQRERERLLRVLPDKNWSTSFTCAQVEISDQLSQLTQSFIKLVGIDGIRGLS